MLKTENEVGNSEFKQATLYLGLRKANIVRSENLNEKLDIAIVAAQDRSFRFYNRCLMRVVTFKAGTEYYRVNGLNVVEVLFERQYNGLSQKQKDNAIGECEKVLEKKLFETELENMNQ